MDDALQDALHEPLTRPRRFALRMAAFTVAAAAGCTALFPALEDAFFANVVLNSTILGVLVIGVVFVFWKTLRLGLEVSWIEAYRTHKGGISNIQPRLLSSMATMLGEVEQAPHEVRMSHAAMRSLLDGIGTRLDEQRDLARYWIGLLVFLGLLGTFWGLLGTVGGVADAISGLEVDGDRGAVSVFDDLKAKLETPLAGMATAFSSSLFGLGGSLILGFLELQSAQAQNRFYNELEEWLSSLTRLGAGSSLVDGEQSAPAYIAALLEQTAESVDALRRVMQDGEARREVADRQLGEFAEKLTEFTEQVRVEGKAIAKLTETQDQLKDVLGELTAVTKSDAETRTQLASLDKHLGKMVEETAKGHKALVDSFRSEIKLLAKTIAAKRTKT